MEYSRLPSTVFAVLGLPLVLEFSRRCGADLSMIAMSRPSLSQVFAVDPHPGDYSELAVELSGQGLELRLFRSAAAALRHSDQQPPELWLVNMHLPGFSGPDLAEMLRDRYPDSPVFLVGDDYDSGDEIAARQAGAEMYLCKPLCGELLSTAIAH